MSARFRAILGAMGAIATLTTVTTAAVAQTSTTTPQTIPAEIERLFFSNSGTYFYNRSTWREFSYMFGPGGFDSATYADLEVERDAQALHKAYIATMTVQNQSDPFLRVPDLRNPYNTSYQLLPTTQSGSRVLGSEFVFERIPLP